MSVFFHFTGGNMAQPYKIDRILNAAVSMPQVTIMMKILNLVSLSTNCL